MNTRDEKTADENHVMVLIIGLSFGCCDSVWRFVPPN